jgi:hypothetical protein
MAARHKGKKKSEGGGIEEAGGNPDVLREAKEKKKGGKVGGHKSKHRMDRAAGGAVNRATGGAVPGRKRGGRVGADTSPLSSAHNTSSPERKPVEEEGGLST